MSPQCSAIVRSASVAGLLLAATAVTASPTDLDMLVSSYEASLSRLNPAEFNVHERTYYQGTVHQLERRVNDDHWFVRRDGERWKIRLDGLGWNRRNEAAPPQKMKFTQVLTGDRCIRLWWDKDATKAKPSIMSYVNVPDNERRDVFQFGRFMFVYGYVSSSTYIPERLRQSSLQVRPERLGTKQTVLLEGDGQFGTYKLWLDPALGYLPRRFRLVQHGDDLVQGKPLRERASGLRSWTTEVCDCEFQQIGSVYVPKRFTTVRKTLMNDRATTVRSVVELSHIDLDPDVKSPEAFEITQEIPSGTPVQMNDQMQIDYVWHDGTIVKKVDFELGRRKRETFFGTGVPKSVVFMLVAAVMLFVVVFALLMVRNKRRSTRT